MARYIDAEKMKLSYAWWGATKARDLLYDIIDNQPTADVVKVVRCKDCKFCRVENTDKVYAVCLKKCYAFDPLETDIRTHFCSFGKRR